jgi:hypothetical protein
MAERHTEFGHSRFVSTSFVSPYHGPGGVKRSLNGSKHDWIRPRRYKIICLLSGLFRNARHVASPGHTYPRHSRKEPSRVLSQYVFDDVVGGQVASGPAQVASINHLSRRLVWPTRVAYDDVPLERRGLGDLVPWAILITCIQVLSAARAGRER